ncbi:MAG: hypothetical protein HKP30_07870 [Myxococcales bacterium]|nr:hypothetical protein [Myxococcales bacterium]
MHHDLATLFTVFALLAAAPALADAPAAIPDAAQTRAGVSFDAFAAKWMKKARGLEVENRSDPTVKPGTETPLVTYRGYSDDYHVELRPTGHPSAPYVGLLRYTELVYSCRTVAAKDCSVASSVPVTEIFRYQDGRWNY